MTAPHAHTRTPKPTIRDRKSDACFIIRTLKTQTRERGYTIDHIAQHLGVSRNTVSMWQSRAWDKVPAGMLDRWAKYVGLGGLTLRYFKTDAGTCCDELDPHPDEASKESMRRGGTYDGSRYKST